MSRQIDVSDPSKLSDEDKRYLQDRNRLPAGVEPVDVKLTEAGIGHSTKPEPVSPNPDTLRQAGDGDDDSTSDQYKGWTVAQLQQELEDRGLATSGNKPELLARLEEDDASTDDDEEDTEDEEED